mgnify:CR=1 FL=1
MNNKFIEDDVDVVALAGTFAEELRSRAEEFEGQGFVSQDIADRLAELGLYRLCNPKKFGGLGRSPLDYALLVEALAQSDASTAWVVFIGITSALSVTNLPTQVAVELLSDTQAITAGVFAPMGRAIACEENGMKGFKLTGQWQWGSGSRNATYLSAGGFLVDESGELLKLANGRPDQRSFFMPVSDVELLDTWHVTGLKGTGSTDFKVEGVFVPEFMTFDAFRENTPQGAIHSFPLFAFLGIGIGAVALGIARASLNEFIALAKQKTPQGSSKPLAMKPATHKQVAEAEAKLRSARLFFYDAISTAWQLALENDAPTVEARRDVRLATTHAVQSAAEVVDSIYKLAGGTSVYLRSPIQRYFRDVHVATQHMMVNESTLELVGRLLVGIDTNVDQL